MKRVLTHHNKYCSTKRIPTLKAHVDKIIAELRPVVCDVSERELAILATAVCEMKMKFVHAMESLTVIQVAT